MSKKKHIPHLDFYEECMEDNERLPIDPFSLFRRRCEGLCLATHRMNLDYESLYLFEPNREDEKRLKRKKHNEIFWGSGRADPAYGEFTPLRQTIILFIAAINKEL